MKVRRAFINNFNDCIADEKFRQYINIIIEQQSH